MGQTTTEENIITDSIHHRIQVRHYDDGDDDTNSAISTLSLPLFVVITALINLWYLMNGNS